MSMEQSMNFHISTTFPLLCAMFQTCGGEHKCYVVMLISVRYVHAYTYAYGMRTCRH